MPTNKLNHQPPSMLRSVATLPTTPPRHPASQENGPDTRSFIIVLCGVFLATASVAWMAQDLHQSNEAQPAAKAPPPIHAAAYLKTPVAINKAGSIPWRPVPPSLITSTASASLPTPVNIPEKSEPVTAKEEAQRPEASGEDIDAAERMLASGTWPTDTSGARVAMARHLWEQFPRIYQATSNDPYTMPYDALKKEFYERIRLTTFVGPRFAALPDPATNAGP